MKAFAEFSEQVNTTAVDNDELAQAEGEIQAEGTTELLAANDDLDLAYILPSHFRCAAHRFNLVATKNTALDTADASYKWIYRSLIGKLQAM